MNKPILCLIMFLSLAIKASQPDLFHEITEVGTIVVINGRVYLDGPGAKLDNELIACYCGARPSSIELLKDGRIVAFCCKHDAKRSSLQRLITDIMLLSNHKGIK